MCHRFHSAAAEKMPQFPFCFITQKQCPEHLTERHVLHDNRQYTGTENADPHRSLDVHFDKRCKQDDQRGKQQKRGQSVLYAQIINDACINCLQRMKERKHCIQSNRDHKCRYAVLQHCFHVAVDFCTCQVGIQMGTGRGRRCTVAEEDPGHHRCGGQNGVGTAHPA